MVIASFGATNIKKSKRVLTKQQYALNELKVHNFFCGQVNGIGLDCS